ncbi:UNVERIFIED_ORG: hypothetical protein J2W19_000367 [Shinella zoogloeoides]|nr:hypothetical protein [Shinella zoogloeoides]
MPTTYQIVALSSLDPEGTDTRDEPKLVFPDALKMAQGLKDQGKAFRVFADGEPSGDQLQALRDLGAVEVFPTI